MITLFGLIELTDGAVWWLSGLTLLLLLFLWIRLVVIKPAGITIPPSWLYVPLAIVTVVAIWLASTIHILFLTWSLLWAAWFGLAWFMLGAERASRYAAWIGGPLLFWAILVATLPVPEPLYTDLSTLPVWGQFFLAAGLLLPLVCWPILGWIRVVSELPRQTAVFLLLWPAIAALIPLGRILIGDGLQLTLLLLLLLLVGLGVGIPWLWSRLALADRLPLTQFKQAAQHLYAAIQDALRLLEGEAGLLWLVGLLVLALLFN